MNDIIPRNEAEGTDICATRHYFYIIRSDLGCYMQTSDLSKGSDISIFSLHPSCQNGDHYIADENGYFYIIKGDSYRRVTNLTTDSNAKVYKLHPNFQGRDHYLTDCGNFYAISQIKGTYRMTTDLSEDSDAGEHHLPHNCRNGLYYWGNQFFKRPSPFSRSLFTFSFLKSVSEWGVQFCDHSECQFNDSSDDGSDVINRTSVYSVHIDVLNFLPGGLSITNGPAFGIWESIKTITNDSTTPVSWQQKINLKVGYNKQKMSQITRNWNISTTASIESGELSKLIAKAQFSFSAEYGGSHVSTENEIWNEETEMEDQITCELKPKDSLYLWQYKVCLGKESLLFCRDLKLTKDQNPPAEVPLPPALS